MCPRKMVTKAVLQAGQHIRPRSEQTRILVASNREHIENGSNAKRGGAILTAADGHQHHRYEESKTQR